MLHVVPFFSITSEVSVNIQRSPYFEMMSMHKMEHGRIPGAPIRYNADGVLMHQDNGYRWHTQLFGGGSLEHVQSLDYCMSRTASFVSARDLCSFYRNGAYLAGFYISS